MDKVEDKLLSLSQNTRTSSHPIKLILEESGPIIFCLFNGQLNFRFHYHQMWLLLLPWLVSKKVLAQFMDVMGINDLTLIVV